jgi:magnesium transporter
VIPIGDPVRQLRVLGRFVRRATKRPGTAPGTLVHTGPRKVEQVRITFLDYDAGELREREAASLAEVLPFRDSPTVTWVNVDGLHDVELIRSVGEHFEIHSLVLEDILSLGQRPKVEEAEDYLYVVLQMMGWNAEAHHVEEEQLSLVIGRNWVFTFQERVGDYFEPVRERLRQGKGKIRSRGADYLGYALIDAVVDHYFQVLEGIGTVTEALELEVLDDPSQRTMERLHHLKRELLVVRRAVWPVRDLTNGLVRSESSLIHPTTKVFLRDVYDHTVQIIDSVEGLRDVISGMIDLYLSSVSHRTNEVMKVLTIVGSIFIPLTFLAGIYGMNFDYMPELDERWAYPALWGVMLVVAGGLVAFFRRKGWL